MTKELDFIEINVLAVALDHMEEHLQDVIIDMLGTEDELLHRERLNAVETLRIKLL
jgi:hypothetical protein